MLLNKNRKNKGFSLIELILVLGISSLAFIGFIKMEQKRAEINRASIAGEQIKEVGEALEVYIARNPNAIATAVPVGTTSANLPITLLTGTPFGAFPGTQLLPVGYVNRNIIGGAYDIRLRNEAGLLIGLVVTTNPIGNSDGTATIRYDLAGAAMKRAGSKSAVAFLVNNQISGFDGAWSLTQAQFPSINTAGQLAYRAQSFNAATFDNVYLRLDGTNSMAANLNVGNFNINNVTDINFNGWLNGNNILVNTVRSGSITNTGNITNGGQIDSTGQIIARNSVETKFINLNGTLGRDLVVGTGAGGGAAIAQQGAVYARDLYIRGGAGGRPAIDSGAGAWITDLLPRYSSRGVIVVSNGSTFAKPNCPFGTTAAKVEVIPQLMWQQGRVLGTFDSYTGANSFAGMYTVSSWVAFAVDLGWGWQINLSTVGYNGSYINGVGLAHVYCDNGF